MKYTKEKNQETALAITLGLLVIWYFTAIKVLITVAFVLILIALFSQTLAGWVTWFWMKLSHIMGFVMSRVLLSAIFFLFLFPIALLSRLFKKDGLQLKRTSGSSYYTERNHTFNASDIENPW